MNRFSSCLLSSFSLRSDSRNKADSAERGDGRAAEANSKAHCRQSDSWATEADSKADCRQKCRLSGWSRFPNWLQTEVTTEWLKPIPKLTADRSVYWVAEADPKADCRQKCSDDWAAEANSKLMRIDILILFFRFSKSCVYFFSPVFLYRHLCTEILSVAILLISYGTSGWFLYWLFMVR